MGRKITDDKIEVTIKRKNPASKHLRVTKEVIIHVNKINAIDFKGTLYKKYHKRNPVYIFIIYKSISIAKGYTQIIKTYVISGDAPNLITI